MNSKKIDRNTFIEYWQKRNNPKTLWKFLIVYIAGIFCFLLATKIINNHFLFVVAWFVLFFTYLIGMPFFWNRLLYGKSDSQFMKCPFCKKSLGNISHIVIATGKCGHCGKQILSNFIKDVNHV